MLLLLNMFSRSSMFSYTVAFLYHLPFPEGKKCNSLYLSFVLHEFFILKLRAGGNILIHVTRPVPVLYSYEFALVRAGLYRDISLLYIRLPTYECPIRDASRYSQNTAFPGGLAEDILESEVRTKCPGEIVCRII